ncbi:hypothetical protein DFH06DRAFT_1336521 [Mycena polygramma]|nr:hypothetical protein DFH06DRAFT_1336521 [Mycena polygramma]
MAVSIPDNGAKPPFGRLPFDLLNKSLLDFACDPLLDPKEKAVRLGTIARVSRRWKSHIYSSSAFWSSIVITKRTPWSSLEFVVRRCGPAADISLRLTLLDVRTLDKCYATRVVVDAWIDAVFDRISHSAPRWVDFELDTDNALVFNRVRHHCGGLLAVTLQNIELSYTYLSGFHPAGDALDLALPFIPRPWFQSCYPELRRLSSYCVPLLWDDDSLFENLEVVELTDFSCPEPLPVDVLPRLFLLATRLRSVRLGTLVPFSTTPGYSLRSSSLRSLDVDFDGAIVAGDILSSLDAPNLVDLTVRDVRDLIHRVLLCSSLLERLERFCAWGELGDAMSLHHLFTSMRRLRVLDLVHSRPQVFASYCNWVHDRVRAGHYYCLADIRALHLPAVDLRMVVNLINAVCKTVPAGEGRVGVERLRVELPCNWDMFGDEMEWLRAVVSDLAFTRFFCPSGTTRDLILGNTFHSLLS